MSGNKNFTTIYFDFFPNNKDKLSCYFTLIKFEVTKNNFDKFKSNIIKFYPKIGEAKIYYNEIYLFLLKIMRMKLYQLNIQFILKK